MVVKRAKPFKPKKIKLKLWMRTSGKRTKIIDAVVVTPHIAVHRHLEGGVGWYVSHVKTGIGLAFYEPMEKDEAVTYARWLGRLKGIDWSNRSFMGKDLKFLKPFVSNVLKRIQLGERDVKKLSKLFRLSEAQLKKVKEVVDAK